MYNLSIYTIIKQLNTHIKNGLTTDQVTSNHDTFGYNVLDHRKPTPLWKKFLNNFKEFMIIILMIASVISFFIGEKTDAVIIIMIVLLNGIISTYQEMKAEESIESLKSLTTPSCVVMRNSQKMEIKAEDLVPGDIVFIEAGNFIPADGRLIDITSLKVEESTLTGESVPVEKNIDLIEGENIPIGDQLNSVFSGTIVTYGSGTFVVTSIGMKTQLGKIADLISEEKLTMTPLQVKLKEIGKIIGIIVLIVSTLIFTLGIIQGRDLFEMFFTAVSLAVAAIPEGLPAIVTIVLALGVRRLSQKNAIIRKLPAVETLGSSSVICSDKTGTLTQNKMTIMDTYYQTETDKDALIICSLLCNDASLTKEQEIGDPTETALLRYGVKEDYHIETLIEKYPRSNGIPFDSVRKMMTTIHQSEDTFISYTKGAVDELLNRCSSIMMDGKIMPLNDSLIQEIVDKNQSFATNALRVLAFAKRDWSSLPEDISTDTIENNLVFLGLLAMMDPPREEVKQAIENCHRAGIKPVMITGDHLITAKAIAEELGILREGDEIISGQDLQLISDEELTQNIEKYSVYARVSPEHKVKIVKAWQSKGHVVAMTGDGVNDAPALRMAEIGIAMGKVGTDVSRNAAAMVLMDDNFATIIAAIEEGRSIYSNIRKSIRYLLSCNFGEIFLLLIAMLMNLQVPLLPIHILWVNLVTDSFPALALGVEPKDLGLLNHPPRKKNESLFSDGLFYKIALEGLLVGAISLAIYIYALNFSLEIARTMTFLTLSFSQLIHSINVRSADSVVFKKGLFTNKFSLYAIAVSLVLQLTIIFIPFTRSIFKIVSLPLNLWMIVILSSLIPLILVEIIKLIRSAISKSY